MRVMRALVLGSVLCGSGCARNVTAPRPTPIRRAAMLLDDFAASTQAAQTAEIAVYQAGDIDTATHIALQQAFLTIAHGTAAISTLMSTNASKATINTAVSSLVEDIDTDLESGVFHVKNPDSRVRLQRLVTTLAASAQSIAVAYGG